LFLKRTVMALCSLAIMIVSENVLAETGSMAKVSAREPLTYRNMGLYATWDAPGFDFVIVRSPVIWGKDEAADSKLIEAWSENLAKARANNKRVIVDLLWQHWGMKKESNYRAAEAFLSQVDVDEMYAITLGEEHIFWDGRHQMLVDLYHRIKEKYPDLPVYQWYSPTSRGTDWPGFTWPWLPADGWVVDEYHAVPSDFEQNVRHHLMLGVPLIQIVWAAPEMSSSAQFHQGVFEGQLRIAQKYNVPCAFFCYDGPSRGTWGWQENAAESSRKVFQLILDAAKKAKAVADEDLLDWDNACKPLETVLEKSRSGWFTYRESFDFRMKPAGEKLPKHTFMQRSLIRGLRNMKCAPNPSRIIVRSDGRRPVDASITNHWRTPNGERCRFTASAKIAIEPGVLVEVIFEVSPNGYDWVAKNTKIKDGLIQVNVPTVNTELYTRLRIAEKTAKAGPTLATIDWIEVRGKISQ